MRINFEMRTSGGRGGISDFGHPRTRGRGVEKGQIFADVLYGWPLNDSFHLSVFLTRLKSILYFTAASRFDTFILTRYCIPTLFSDKFWWILKMTIYSWGAYLKLSPTLLYPFPKKTELTERQLLQETTNLQLKLYQIQMLTGLSVSHTLKQWSNLQVTCTDCSVTQLTLSNSYLHGRVGEKNCKGADLDSFETSPRAVYSDNIMTVPNLSREWNWK